MGCISQRERFHVLPPLLVIGTAGSGKSTFCKQMQILHKNNNNNKNSKSTDKTNKNNANGNNNGNNNCNNNDNAVYKAILLTNILVGFKERISLMEKHGDSEVCGGENLKFKRTIVEASTFDTEWNDKLATAVNTIWKDEQFQKANLLSAEHQVQITQLSYLMDHMSQYMSEDYIPNNEDILRARQRTTGINEVKFRQGHNEWTLIDLGGQFSEREKWTKYLGQIDVDEVKLKAPISFLAFISLDEYNIKSNEQPEITKFYHALNVISNFSVMKEAAEMLPIIILNKIDLFSEKIMTEDGFSSFKKNFPKYSGEQSIESTSNYLQLLVQQTISSALSDRELKREIPVKITCALDIELMKNIFDNIKSHCFAMAYAQAGLSI